MNSAGAPCVRPVCGGIIGGGRRLALAGTLLRLALPLRAGGSPGSLDLQGFERNAAGVFAPEIITSPGSSFENTCAAVLLMTQAIAALIIIAGLLTKMRQSHAQMEGIASTMIKVAFIATLPFWRTLTLETANVMANAAGFQTLASTGPASPIMTQTWTLLGQWVPPGSPFLDALEAQTSGTPPPSGEEEAWGLRAWNWARGVGVATEDMFQWLWQTFSGGLRATLVFVGCGLMVCAVALSMMAMYLSEMFRLLLFYLGCASAPLFIAGLGVDALRSQSTRFLLTVTSIAFWPVGWAVANVVTGSLMERAVTWMSSAAAVALQGPADPSFPSLAVAAPYLSWGILFLFSALTVAICLWLVASVLLVPLLFSKLLATASNTAAVWLGSQPSAPVIVPPPPRAITDSSGLRPRRSTTPPNSGVARGAHVMIGARLHPVLPRIVRGASPNGSAGAGAVRHPRQLTGTKQPTKQS